MKQFWKEYLIPNKPVCLTDLTQNWNCWNDFRLKNTNTLNFEWLDQKFGSLLVPVVDTSKQTSYFSAADSDSISNQQQQNQWSFSSYLKYLKERNTTTTQNDSSSSKFYLKDWHFVSELKGKYSPYETPLVFSDDWLNNVSGRLDWQTNRGMNDDYKFLYFGIAGTKSYLHTDVFQSYSWSTNIVGRKKWIFFSPNDCKMLFENDQIRAQISDIESIVDLKLKEKFWKYAIVFIQQPGETIFVPSGWMHQVENLDDCLSFNHNWGNASNLANFWNFIQSETLKVELAIQDCRETCENEQEWNELVQKVLLANIGIDHAKFLSYIEINIKDLISNASFLVEEEYLQFSIQESKKVLQQLGYGGLNLISTLNLK